MTAGRLVAGNWKMHGTSDSLGEIAAIADGSRNWQGVDVALCLPATLIDRAARSVPGFAIGGQDVDQAASGARTGCISVAMLRDSGASLTIVGHSERRDAQKESDSDVRAKAEAAIAGGLGVILCVGESLAVRESGSAIDIVRAQLESSLPRNAGEPGQFAVAYEPVWAIGTGRIPKMDDIALMHGALRQLLVAAYGGSGRSVRLLYGGSVKGSNAAEIFALANVDGALVGGASLTAADFLPIVAAAAG